MFYGTRSSHIEFPNKGGLDTRFSITMMCWVQHVGQGGPLFSYGVSATTVSISIDRHLFFNEFVRNISFETYPTRTYVGFPAGKWIHVAATYDHNSGNNSLYINGHLRRSRNIGTGYEIATASRRVRMGVKDDSIYFKGKIAEMKVYDVALNEAQIQTSIRQGS